MRKKTILFLISDTGAGHRSAAKAIDQALALLVEQDKQAGLEPVEYETRIIDVFAERAELPVLKIVKLYGPLIRYNPELYGKFFTAGGVVLDSAAHVFAISGLMRLLTEMQPDMVVSIHPLVNSMTVRALREINLRVPFITVVTDLVSMHPAWFAPGADAYLVPTEQARQFAVHCGIDAARVHVLGMPIHPKFTQPLPPRNRIRKNLGLLPGKPVVLLTGGGDGAGGLKTAVRAIARANLPVQLLVVTGRNALLLVSLRKLQDKFAVPMTLFGFVDNMPELMHAADIIITKAGPGTICEALACQLPIVLSGFIPGTEEGNVTYVLEHRAGMLALDSATLVASLGQLIDPQSTQLAILRRNAKKLSRPRAVFAIADFLRQLLART